MLSECLANGWFGNQFELSRGGSVTDRGSPSSFTQKWKLNSFALLKPSARGWNKIEFSQ